MKKEFIPIKGLYQSDEDKTHEILLNLLNFNYVRETEDGSCILKNLDLNFEINTDYSFDEIICLLDDNYGESIYDYLSTSGLRSIIIHYVYLKNEGVI